MALFPCAKITVASLCALSHFFAAFCNVKKKSTGNFVMNPSLIVPALDAGAAGLAGAPLVQTATTASATTSASTGTVRFFDAAYNAYAGEKRIAIYPHNDHEGGGAFHQVEQMTWLL